MRLIRQSTPSFSILVLMLTVGSASALAQQTGFNSARPASEYFSAAAGWNQTSAYYDSIRLTDVNGDGKPDLCGRGYAGIVCALGNGDGTFSALNVWTSDFSDAAGWGDPQYGTTIMFADINNDGLADVCGRSPAGIQCDLSTGNSFKAQGSLASEYFSDAAGWGQSTAYYGSIRLADVNGDGKPDLCGRGYAGIVCALGNGDGTFGPLNVWTSDFSNAAGWGDPQYGTTIMFADINNDGLADVCGRAPAGIQCDLSTGNGFTSLTSLASEYFSDAAGWGQSSAYYDSIRLADVNGDGKPDLCGRGYAGIVCALGNGDGTFGGLNVWTPDFSNAAGWGDPQYGTTIMFADTNKDGSADVCGRGAAGMACALSADLHDGAGSAYNQVILRDHPVAFWQMNPQTNTEPDLSGNGITGCYKNHANTESESDLNCDDNGVPGAVTMPNGDQVASFTGSSPSQFYLSVPSNAYLSIPTTHNLTWEVWIQPAVLQFSSQIDPKGYGYVDVMGKCANYSPTCEWETRFYTDNPEYRPNRLSAYVFNPTAHEGSGADWQPAPDLFYPGEWLHVVGEYTTLSQPAVCSNSSTYPGSIDIWVNGVKWDQSAHGQTGCMSQYLVTPQAKSSRLNIGTMAFDTWFEGAIGKVAIYNYLLTQEQITSHYEAMIIGQQPTGSCTDTCNFKF